jgi:redox-sensing transcriptional repressor
MTTSTIPHVVIERLPLYLRCVALLLAQGQTVISSQEMATNLGISSAQIRKDLSYFGEFGKQGMGYDLCFLKQQLERILNLHQTWRVILIGAGDLGHALANFRGFQERGFEIAAVFDNDPAKVGQLLGDCLVQHVDTLEATVRKEGIKVAIIAVPAAQAPIVAGKLVAAGIEAILNYAPVSLSLPPEVHVSYIDPLASLQSMTYYLD